MDYTAILKKSWNVTWRFKILWLFGLFAGAGGGSLGGGSSSWRGNSTSMQGLPNGMSTAQVQAFVERHSFVLIVAALFLVLLGLFFFIISVAARGGLIHLVNEAEEGREVRASAGWHAGFSKWWRVFGVGFLADLPIVILVMVLAAFVAVIGFGAYVSSRGTGQGIGAALATGFVGLCCVGVVFFAAVAFLGVTLGITKELAFRYVVLEDRRVIEALKAGWRDLWAKRGSFVMYLIQVGVGIAFGVVVAIVAVMTLVPGGVLIFMGSVPAGALLVVLAVLVLMVPSAVYGAFYHAVWTIFFRRMTGAEPAAVAAAPAVTGYPPVPPMPLQPPASSLPSESPAPPEPPAPPIQPEPPVPPAPQAGTDA